MAAKSSWPAARPAPGPSSIALRRYAILLSCKIVAHSSWARPELTRRSLGQFHFEIALKDAEPVFQRPERLCRSGLCIFSQTRIFTRLFAPRSGGRGAPTGLSCSMAHPQGSHAQGRTHRALVLKGAETLATSGIEGYVALNVGGKDNAAPRLAEDRLAAQRL